MSWGISWGERALNPHMYPFLRGDFHETGYRYGYRLPTPTGATYLDSNNQADPDLVCQIYFWRYLWFDWWREPSKDFWLLHLSMLLNVAAVCSSLLWWVLLICLRWEGRNVNAVGRSIALIFMPVQLFIPNRIWLLWRGVNHCKSPIPSERRRNDDNLSLQLLTLFG